MKAILVAIILAHVTIQHGTWAIVSIPAKHCWYPIRGNGPTPAWVAKYGAHCAIQDI
jgi:hypothetical protein